MGPLPELTGLKRSGDYRVFITANFFLVLSPKKRVRITIEYFMPEAIVKMSPTLKKVFRRCPGTLAQKGLQSRSPKGQIREAHRISPIPYW
jgi:hypothetical protein